MIIKLENVSKFYKDSNFNLQNISFEINSGDVIGIIGKNGTGKSTILKMITGLVDIDSGQILYKDKNINNMSEQELREMRKNVSYIFQNFNLLEGETVYYHLSLVYKLRKQKIDDTSINNILKFMNIEKFKNVTCRNLSGGQQQKVAIAMSILQNPEVLLCDEISSALDVNSEKEIYDLLIKLKNNYNISLIIISHNLSVLKNFCDKVLIIDDNTIREVITPKKSKNNDYNEDYFLNVKEFLLND